MTRTGQDELARSSRVKSKKWERRRPQIVILKSPNGWHKRMKFTREFWTQIERSAASRGETIQEFFTAAIKSALERHTVDKPPTN